VTTPLPPDATAEEPPPADAPAPGRTKRKSSWHELPLLLGVALVLALLIKTFLVQAFFIPSGSMENTLAVNDRVLVNKVVYHLRPVHRGDIIVFSGTDSWSPEVYIPPATNPVSKGVRWVEGLFGLGPSAETDFIKRVIGVPGDHVVCCDTQGRITVNGVALTEPYLYPGESPSDTAFNVIVPPGRLWVMGDHRAFSSDSRAHLGDPGGGTIPIDKVVGRAFVVIWPVSHWATLPTPATFQQHALTAAGRVGTAATPFALSAAAVAPLALWRRRRRRRP